MASMGSNKSGAVEEDCGSPVNNKLICEEHQARCVGDKRDEQGVRHRWNGGVIRGNLSSVKNGLLAQGWVNMPVFSDN
jgi:hypothetical protein